MCGTRDNHTSMYIYILDGRWILTRCTLILELEPSPKTWQSDSCHVHLGCISPPLFNIELEDIILDELHLLLHITDVLIQNLILFADSSDHRSKAHCGVVTSHVKELEAAIQSCGVTFQIQQKREANG